MARKITKISLNYLPQKYGSQRPFSFYRAYGVIPSIGEDH